MIISQISHIGHISPISLISLLSFITLLTLSGCSGSDDLDDGLSGAVIGEVRSYATHFNETKTKTRAWTPPTGYEAYEGGDQPIAFALTQNGTAPKMGHFFKSSGVWRTNIEEIKAENYYLYGFIPNMAGIQYSITDLDGGNAHYSDGAIMTLDNVPAVMPNDLCVVIGAKEGTDADTDNGLRMGDFKYAAKAISDDGKGNKVDGGNYVFLLFDHIYSALRINMRVHGDYANLRTIKLKSLQLSTKVDGAATKQKTKIEIRLEPTDGTTSPIKSVTYTQDPEGDDNNEGIVFWSYSGGQELTTGYQTFTGHFMPQDVNTLILTSVYDVYDNKENLIRKDCKATNTIELSELELTETQRGRRYTINMTIKPTYLYVLSDPDLDDPEVVIN